MSLVGDLVRQLDGFNQLRPRAAEEDEEDMMWPGIRGKLHTQLDIHSYVCIYRSMYVYIVLCVCAMYSVMLEGS